MMQVGQEERSEGKNLQRNFEPNKKNWVTNYNLKTPERAKMIQGYADKALGRYEHLAQQGIPEQQRQNYLRDIDRAGTSALSQSSSRRGGLVGIGQINQNQTDSYADLLEMDSTTRLQNQYRLAEVAPQYESAGDMYTMQRENRISDMQIKDIYDDRDYGRWLENEGFQKVQEGWAQFDEDLMTWMTMGASGGMGGGGGDKGEKERRSYGKSTNRNTGGEDLNYA